MPRLGLLEQAIMIVDGAVRQRMVDDRRLTLWDVATRT